MYIYIVFVDGKDWAMDNFVLCRHMGKNIPTIMSNGKGYYTMYVWGYGEKHNDNYVSRENIINGII